MKKNRKRQDSRPRMRKLRLKRETIMGMGDVATETPEPQPESAGQENNCSVTWCGACI